jgi:hypothetical protein
LPSRAIDAGTGPAARKGRTIAANDTFDVFLLWTIWTLAATGAALLVMAALI